MARTVRYERSGDTQRLTAERWTLWLVGALAPVLGAAMWWALGGSIDIAAIDADVPDHCLDRGGQDIEATLDFKVSDTTLRARRDEWIIAGVFDQIALEAIAAFDRIIGLDLSEVSIDGSLHKAPKGGEGTGENPCDRAKLGWSGRSASMVTAYHSVGRSMERTATTSN